MLRERARIFLEKGRQLGVQLGAYVGRAAQQAPVQKADIEFDILFVKLRAFRDCVNGMAQSQAGVPEQSYEFGKRVLQSSGWYFALEQNQNVDIGARKQLASSKAAD